MSDEKYPDFSYQLTKAGVTLCYRGRRVTLLRGRKAADFAARITDLNVEAQQLLMAKLTGNFKRGNERTGRDHGRYPCAMS